MLYLGEMRKERKMKFRKLENPMKPIKVVLTGKMVEIEITPDAEFEVELPKNANKVMVGGNWPKGDN